MFRPEDVSEGTPILTDWVRRVVDMARSRPGERAQVGARVYPTEEINTRVGYDVRTWIDEGLIDYVTPMLYAHNVVDSNMPIAWLVEAAAGSPTPRSTRWSLPTTPAKRDRTTPVNGPPLR